jgi:hypothetical protein
MKFLNCTQLCNFHTICVAILKMKTTTSSLCHPLLMNCTKNCDKEADRQVGWLHDSLKVPSSLLIIENLLSKLGARLSCQQKEDFRFSRRGGTKQSQYT